MYKENFSFEDEDFGIVDVTYNVRFNTFAFGVGLVITDLPDEVDIDRVLDLYDLFKMYFNRFGTAVYSYNADIQELEESIPDVD